MDFRIQGGINRTNLHFYFINKTVVKNYNSMITNILIDKQ
jgi:hypothetical protein